MTDWASGDLALCVDTSIRLKRCVDGLVLKATAGKRLCRGAFYTVLSVRSVSANGLTTGLFLELAAQPGRTAGAWRFIRVTPEEPDEFDAQCIYELTYAPSPVFTGKR